MMKFMYAYTKNHPRGRYTQTRTTPRGESTEEPTVILCGKGFVDVLITCAYADVKTGTSAAAKSALAVQAANAASMTRIKETEKDRQKTREEAVRLPPLLPFWRNAHSTCACSKCADRSDT